MATGCNGFCERGPILLVQPDGIFYQRLKPADVPRLVEEHLIKGRPVQSLMYVPPEEREPVPRMKDIEFFKHQRLIVLRNRGRIDPEKIDDYIAYDGYAAAAKALGDMTPEAIIAEITAAGLRGRGGAGFPTGRKWDAARRAAGDPKYVVCNGDEGDPGAFMDRSVLEADPHAVIEGMIIGARAIGAAQGFLYIRNEYPLAVARIGKALGAGPRLRAPRRGHPGHGIRLRPRDRPRRRAPSSPARRPPSWPRSKAAGPIPRQRPPYPARAGAVGQADGHQQRRDLGQRPLDHPPRGGLVRRRSGRRRARARRSSRSSARSPTPAWSKCRWASPSGRSSTASAAASPAAANSRPSRSAGPRAAAFPGRSSTCRSITRA